MSVDILPTALPLESSEHFSNVLLPYLRTLIRSYRDGNSTSIVQPEEKKRAEALERATIARDGVLQNNHKWLEEPLGVWKEGLQAASTSVSQVSGTSTTKTPPPAKQRKKRVLVLGSGMVAGPAVDEICSWGDVELVVGELDAGFRQLQSLTVWRPCSEQRFI